MTLDEKAEAQRRDRTELWKEFAKDHPEYRWTVYGRGDDNAPTDTEKRP